MIYLTMVDWNGSKQNRRKGWWSEMAKHLICIVRTKCDQCIWCNKLHRNKINPNSDINKFWLVDGIIVKAFPHFGQYFRKNVHSHDRLIPVWPLTWIIRITQTKPKTIMLLDQKSSWVCPAVFGHSDCACEWNSWKQYRNKIQKTRFYCG